MEIVTYNTRHKPNLLERCARHRGLPLSVLGRGVSDWSWKHKVTLVRDHLERGTKAPVVMCLDGDDVLIIGSVAVISRRFEAARCQMLFCSTGSDWPPSELHRRFESRINAEVAPAHRHLSAGAFMGRSEYVLARLREISAAIDDEASWCWTPDGFDDQLGWREMQRRYYPEIRIDTECNVLVRFDKDR